MASLSTRMLALVLVLVFLAGLSIGLLLARRSCHRIHPTPIYALNNVSNQYLYNRSTCLRLLSEYFASQDISPIAFRNSWLSKWVVCLRYLNIPSIVVDSLGPYAFNFILDYLHGKPVYREHTIIEPNLTEYGLPSDAPRPLIVAYNAVLYVNVTNRTKLVPVNVKLQLPVVSVGSAGKKKPAPSIAERKWFLAGGFSFSIPAPLQEPLVQRIIAEIKRLGNEIQTLCYPNISYTGVLFVYYSVPRNASIDVVVRYMVLNDRGVLVEKSFLAVNVWGKGYHMLPINVELYTDCTQYFLSKIYRNLTYLNRFNKLLFKVEVLVDKPVPRGYIVAGIGLPGTIIHYTTSRVIRLNYLGSLQIKTIKK